MPSSGSTSSCRRFPVRGWCLWSGAKAAPPGGRGVAMAFVEIDGLLVRLFDSPVGHAFTFTPAFSFFVDVSSVADHELIHAALADGGTVLMAPADHGFSQWFSWVQDRYGVSWQLNVGMTGTLCRGRLLAHRFTEWATVGGVRQASAVTDGTPDALPCGPLRRRAYAATGATPGGAGSAPGRRAHRRPGPGRSGRPACPAHREPHRAHHRLLPRTCAWRGERADPQYRGESGRTGAQGRCGRRGPGGEARMLRAVLPKGMDGKPVAIEEPEIPCSTPRC